MGKQKRVQADRKWTLHVLFCVALFSLCASAARIFETSHLSKSKISGEKITENTESTTVSFPPPFVQQLFQSDEAHPKQDDAALQDVSLTCARTDVVVRVRPSFYGLGADASELRLGRSCRSTSVLGPEGELLFKYPLTACDSESELSPGYLLYKFTLHYEPSPKRFLSKAHPVTVDIECRYPRNYHMHQLAIQPTWETHILHKIIKTSPTNFHIQLMDETWENPVRSWIFQLGETVNFQVSALDLPPGQKLFIHSCYASPVTRPKSPIKFTIIDNFGCLLDSKKDPGASKFISRTDESVRFTMKTFQFVFDPNAEISLNCELYITADGPSPLHKSCTYMFNRWEALSGDDSTCDCCDTQCVTSKQHRVMMDGIVSSESLWVSSHAGTSNSRVNTNHEHKRLTTEKDELLHKGEFDIVQHEDETSGELEWPTHQDQTAKFVERKAHKLDLMQQNYRAELLGYQRLKPLQEEDSDEEKECLKPADGKHMKAEIKEIMEHENSGDDESEGKTWYFAWT